MKTKSIAVCVVLLIMVTGCTDEAENIVPVNSPSPIAEQNTPIQEVTPTETEFLPTTGPSPTWTLLPTLPQDVVNEKVMLFIETNGGCVLPCWWGIIPGKTTLEEVYEVYVPLGNSSLMEFNGKLVLQITIKTSEEVGEGYSVLYLEISGGVIQGLSVVDHDTKPYSDYVLSDYLKQFGEPSDIYVEIHRDLVFFTLLFPDEGLRLHFQDVQNQLLSDSNFFACPQTAKTFHIRTWDPGENRIEEIIENEVFVEGWPYVFPLEEVTDLTVTDFKTIFLDPNTDYCVSGSFTP